MRAGEVLRRARDIDEKGEGERVGGTRLAFRLAEREVVERWPFGADILNYDMFYRKNYVAI